ncbi:MAG TPA: GyrI-like domain-containing protein, partial [Pseudacidobacterium sp.]|jgi:predicted transcriptional regulator YdeE|nr:GyrI-like domain-containing protein [Pseudacidobacterium sp.]
MKRIFIISCLFCAAALTHAQNQIQPKVEVHQTFNVIGVAVRTNNKDEAGGQGEIPKLWQRFVQQSIASKIPNRADSDLLAVYTDYESNQNGEYTYLIGARVTSADDVPVGLTLKEIPEGRYAEIHSEKGPLSVVIPKVWQRIYSMPATDLGGERAFKADYEVYPQGFDPQNTQITVYIGLK